MDTFSISKKLMFSLKELNSGRETFSTGRIFSPWSTAIRGLTRKSLRGGESNGPATNPFRAQLAIVSEISTPNLEQFDEFLQKQGGRDDFWHELAPNLKLLTAWRALLISKLVRKDSQSEIICSNLEMFKSLLISVGREFEGNLLQYLLSAAPSYELSLGKSGHLSFTTMGLTCCSGMTWLSNSQPQILPQSSGRPNSVLENSQSGGKNINQNKYEWTGVETNWT